MFSKKQIIMMVVLVVVTIIIGIAMYLLYRKTAPSKMGRPTATTTPVGAFPTAGQRVTSTIITQADGTQIVLPSSIGITTTPTVYRPEAVSKISSDFATYASANKNGNYRYHNTLNGKFYRIDTKGKLTELADKTFYNVKDVTWAPTKDLAVIEYPDSSKIIYNFEKNTQVSIPKHWQEFSFSSDSSEIAAKSMGLSPSSRYLITTKDDGTGTKIIEGMGNNSQYVDISWSPSKQVVAFSQTGRSLGGDRREVLMVGLNGENFKSLEIEGSNFEPQWSDTGKKLLYSVNNARSSYKPELWITDSYGDSIGNNRTLVNLNTWASKCTFSGDTTLFCAVPRTLPVGAGMNKAVANSTYDNLYKIDLTTGLKTPLSLGNDNFTVDTISYNKTKGKILFTDLNKTGIYEVNL